MITGTGALALQAVDQIADTASITHLGTSTDCIPTQTAAEVVKDVTVNSSTGGGNITNTIDIIKLYQFHLQTLDLSIIIINILATQCLHDELSVFIFRHDLGLHRSHLLSKF